MPRSEHEVGRDQRARACASPQPSSLAAKPDNATCSQLVSAHNPTTDNSERWLVVAEDTGSEASHDTVQVHARVPSGAGRDWYRCRRDEHRTAARLRAHAKGTPKRSWPRAVGGRSFGKELKGSSQKESEWARGVVMADGGNAPLCHARPSGLPPPPPSRPRTTTPFPNHINTPHTTLVASIHSQRSQYESVVPSFG